MSGCWLCPPSCFATGLLPGILPRGRALSGRAVQPRAHLLRPRGGGGAGPELQAIDPLRDLSPLRRRGRESVFQYTRGTGRAKAACTASGAWASAGISRPSTPPATAANPYEEGMRRELEEEVAIDTPYTARCVGLINDDETEVGPRPPGRRPRLRRRASGRPPAGERDHRVRFSPRRRDPRRHGGL